MRFRTRIVEGWYRRVEIILSSAAVTQLGFNICCRGISLTKSVAFFYYALGVVSIDEEVSHFIGLLREICIIRTQAAKSEGVGIWVVR